VGDHRGLHGEGIEAGIVEEAPEPFEPVEQVVLGMREPSRRRRREGTGERGEATGSSSEEGTDEQGEIRDLRGSECRQSELIAARIRGYHDSMKPPVVRSGRSTSA
jgi:hypothetical protein